MSRVGAPYLDVEFESEGVTLRSRFYGHTQGQGPLPGVVMAHGFTGTITMVIDRFAEAISAAGFTVLLYDHRNLGASDGEPRQQVNPWVQARGYMDGLTYMAQLDEVDANRLAIWGDSSSSTLVVAVAAVDDRVKAGLAQCPTFGPTDPGPDPKGSRFAAIRSTLLGGDVSAKEEEIEGPMPVVSFDPTRHRPALDPLTAYRWFMEYGCRLGTNWSNDVTRARPKTPEPLSAVLCAPQVTVPFLMIASPQDEMRAANPEVARLAFDALASEAKTWMAIDGGHFGLLWHPGELFDQASAAQCEFLKAHL